MTSSACVSFSEKNNMLVGGFNPFEQYARQNGSSPQVGMKMKKIIETTT